MRAALFGYFSHNPYLLLYKKALERQGLVVHLESKKLSLGKLLKRDNRACDVIHLNWIESAYTPSKKLVENRYLKALRGTLRLASFSAALLLAKMFKKTIVYTVHNLNTQDQQEFWPFAILRRMAHRIVFSLSDRILVHNHYAREVLETDYNRKKGVIVIPHGNYIGYYPNQISRLEARRQLGFPGDAFIYLSLGRIRPYKGIEDLISAFEKLKCPVGRLLIVGKNSAGYESELLNLVRGNSAIKLIPRFVPDEDIQLYINACDICVLPYKDITTSGSAILALSFGRPVIVPAITCFPEFITPETGILYDPSDPNALVSALQQARLQSWSESEVLDYAHQFDWDKLGPQLANLYQVQPDR